MKTAFTLGFAALVALPSATGQLVITSFQQNGQLTWTNAVSNATYRVEWANSATGSWQRFEALTNLSSIAATGTTVTVTVPTFYRVVWTDPPNPLGDWDYRGYDAVGALMVTGVLSVVRVTNYNAEFSLVYGTRDFRYAGPSTNTEPQAFLGAQIGSGSWYLGRFRVADGLLTIDWLAWRPEGPQAYLWGKVSGDAYRGDWYADTSSVGPAYGTFEAVRSKHR